MPTKKELNDEANDFHRLWGDEQIRRRKTEAALADLVAAAEPLEMPEKPLKDDGKFIPPQEVLRFSIKHYDAVVFGGAVERARKLLG